MPTALRIQPLQSNFKGQVLTPESSGYEEARRIWNWHIDRRPAVIARCAEAADVVAAVRFARDTNLVVAVRGGGHNVSGNAVCDDGIMIDLSQMKKIRIDAAQRSADAEPGLTLAEFDAATQQQGLAAALGTVSMTGIAGLTLGGGLGWLMGKYGLSCDNVTEMDVVTADGQLRTASATENEDLFWGLRGAGANFGVVTRFRYKLHPVTTVYGGMAIYPIAQAREVLRLYAEMAEQAPDELCLDAGLLSAPDGAPVVAIVGCYCGAVADGEKALTPVRKLGTPVVNTLGPTPYLDVQKMFDGAFPPQAQNYWKTTLLPALGDDAIDALIQHAARRPGPASFTVLEHLHGAVTRVSADATAFPHRARQFSVLILGIATEARDADPTIAWARGLAAALEPLGNGRAYINYMGQESSERAQAAYGANYPRLVELKNKYDPDNFFCMNQNVRPTARAATR